MYDKNDIFAPILGIGLGFKFHKYFPCVNNKYSRVVTSATISVYDYGLHAWAIDVYDENECFTPKLRLGLGFFLTNI
jgi:hypothetical protein